MIPCLADDLAARRVLIRETDVLRRSARRLTDLLGTLATAEAWLPGDKALLSRDGGVCARDGSRLLFDPDAPFAHRCGRCGAAYEGERHHRAWITRYHIWLSERAIHLALLGALGERLDLSRRAAGILVAYADRYVTYPLEDNVLGPSRPFFSTYLEAIWLLQLATAVAMLDAGPAAAVAPDDRRRIASLLDASSELVASFDEGGSNRQVWNSAAVLAVGVALDDASRRALGMAGVRRLLDTVGPDGLWHEGENYHLFALRGFLLAAEVARWVGEDLYAASALGAMFVAPLAVVRPDLTLPARGDAPYGVSVAQPRFAEVWELGRARTGDAALDDVLARLYAADLPDLPDAGRRELAEQEENRPGARQHRDGLGWKALLWMRPDAPGAEQHRTEPHVLTRRDGVTLRPDPRTVVSVESGPRRGGHGHPDLLHLSVFRGAPILADFGTASYVSPTLHWYRATLAHNAPGIAGRGQVGGEGWCDVAGTAAGVAVARVRARDLLGAGSAASRVVAAGGRWIVDAVTVSGAGDVDVDLPTHPLAGLPAVAGAAAVDLAPGAGAVGHETGYEALRDGVAQPASVAVPLGRETELRLLPRAGERVLSAEAPGPPGDDFGDGSPVRFLVRRAAGRGRWIEAIVDRGADVTVRETADGFEIVENGRTYRVRDAEEGVTVWCDGAAVATLTATPLPSPPAPPGPSVSAAPDATIPLWPAGAAPFAADLPAAWWHLGEESYRQSERSWAARGGTHAEVEIAAQADALHVQVRVVKPVVVVRPPAAPDPKLDNEPPEVHSDGVQIHVGRTDWMGVLALPDFDGGGVRVRSVRGTAAFAGPVAGWSGRTAEGYWMRLRLPVGTPWRRGERCRVTVTVNEMVPGRERRSGQLSTAGGGWVWLRGDRESSAAAIEAEIG